MKFEKFEIGDILVFSGSNSYAAKPGAKAIFKGGEGHFLMVEWIRDELSGEQMNGLYSDLYFTKLEEGYTPKEDRILIENEKDMKFDFEKGKILLMEYFQDELERGKNYTLQAIKESDNFEDIENEIDSFRYFINDIENTNGKITKSKTLSDIFKALIDTDLEDEDETVLSFFIEGLK